MKKLMFLLCFMLMSTTGYAANWQWVSSTDRFSYYVDADALPTRGAGKTDTQIWTKYVDTKTGAIYYNQLQMDFQTKEMHRMASYGVDSEGKPLGQKSYSPYQPYLVRTDSLSRFYFYMRDYLKATRDLDVAMDRKKRYVLIGTGKNKNGQIHVYWLDTETVYRNGAQVRCTLVEVPLNPDNTQMCSNYYRPAVDFNAGVMIFPDYVVTEKNGKTFERRMKVERRVIVPDTMSEKIETTLKQFCKEHPEKL